MKEGSRVRKAAPPALEVKTPRHRLGRAERERQILEGAIAYFSEVGFVGQTRELSSRLGITQPLLYRYFKNKQELVERVYQTVFEKRWNPAWIGLIEDRTLSLRDRLIEFYRQYAQATYRPDWIRIYLHAGLSRPELNQRYIQLIRSQLMPAYCRELRYECGLSLETTPISEEEIEFVWNLHGGVFYMALRQHIYQTPIQVDFMAHVAFVVDNFLAGAQLTYPRLVQTFVQPTPSRPRRRSQGQ